MKSKNLYCPIHHEKLILRVASQGKHKGKKFWGCSTWSSTRCNQIVEFDESDLEQAKSVNNTPIPKKSILKRMWKYLTYPYIKIPENTATWLTSGGSQRSATYYGKPFGTNRIREAGKVIAKVIIILSICYLVLLLNGFNVQGYSIVIFILFFGLGKELIFIVIVLLAAPLKMVIKSISYFKKKT